MNERNKVVINILPRWDMSRKNIIHLNIGDQK